MKNLKIKFIHIIVLLAIFFSAQVATAQEEDHYFTVTTWKIQIPEDGSYKEFNTMLEEWREKVTLKNTKMLSHKVLTHVNGSDRRDWVAITEYANWNDINEARNLSDKLVLAGWPDEAVRTKFFAKLNRYLLTNSDEILLDMPNLGK